MTVLVRYDKSGKQVPDTGHGCGCGLCENTGAPRYERRRGNPAAAGSGGFELAHQARERRERRVTA